MQSANISWCKRVVGYRSQCNNLASLWSFVTYSIKNVIPIRLPVVPVMRKGLTVSYFESLNQSKGHILQKQSAFSVVVFGICFRKTWEQRFSKMLPTAWNRLGRHANGDPNKRWSLKEALYEISTMETGNERSISCRNDQVISVPERGLLSPLPLEGRHASDYQMSSCSPNVPFPLSRCWLDAQEIKCVCRLHCPS